MAATPEARVKKAVDALLKKYGAYYHKPVQNGLGAPSLDYIGCYHGLYYAVETKALGKKPTPRQEHTIAQIEASGGKVFVVVGVEGTAELAAWLADIRTVVEGECYAIIA